MQVFDLKLKVQDLCLFVFPRDGFLDECPLVFSCYTGFDIVYLCLDGVALSVVHVCLEMHTAERACGTSSTADYALGALLIYRVQLKTYGTLLTHLRRSVGFTLCTLEVCVHIIFCAKMALVETLSCLTAFYLGFGRAARVSFHRAKGSIHP